MRRRVELALAEEAGVAGVQHEREGLLRDAPGRRLADLFLPAGWNGDKAVAVDFQVTSPMQQKYLHRTALDAVHTLLESI